LLSDDQEPALQMLAARADRSPRRCMVHSAISIASRARVPEACF